MNIETLKTNTSFRAVKKMSPADDFLQTFAKIRKEQRDGNFISRNMWSSTAILPVLTATLGYEFYLLNKLSKLKKANKRIEVEALKKTFKKRIPFIIGVGIVLIAGLQYLFNKNSDKKHEKIKNLFNEINTDTCATLEETPFRSSVLGAAFNPISGKVLINRNIINDPIANRTYKKSLKHELVHARQNETIARMDNGIKKLNYSIMKRAANNFENPLIKNYFIMVYNDVQNNPSKYNNITLYIDNAPVNFKNYITGVYTLLTNKNADYDDVPIIINKEHYENVRRQKGPLTAAEKEKAQLYYQAQIDYPQMNIFQALNPFSKYRDNLLEVEAYKENPGIYGFIRKLFGKP